MTGVYRELQYSSDSGLGWSSLSSIVGVTRPLRAGNAGPGGIVVNNGTGPFLTFSSDGVTWRTLNNAIPGTLVGALVPGTPQVTTTQLINLQPTGVYHRAIGPAMGSAPWTFTAIAAPQRALAAAHPNVIQVGAEFWWFGAGNTYLVSPSTFTTWTQHSLPFTDVFADVAQGGGLVVALASSRVAVCTDTTQHTWVSERLGLTNPVGIAFANNKFFVYSESQLAVREVLAVGAVVGCGLIGGGPGAPARLAATSGDGTVTLAWQPPVSSGTSAVLGYAVRYRTSPAGDWSPYTASPSTSAIVSGLDNGTAYDFQVIASNAVGPGAQAAATETPHGPLAGAPVGLRATGAGPRVPVINAYLTVPSVNGGFAWRLHDNTTFDLAWEPDVGSVPTRYVVEMKSIHFDWASGFPWRSERNRADLFGITYAGLTASVTPLFDFLHTASTSVNLWNRNMLWSFRVQGVTGDGPGAWSAWSTPTTLMPAPATVPTPVNPPNPAPPTPVVTASASRKEHRCYPWGSGTTAEWWDVVTLSWPSVGGAVSNIEVQEFAPAAGLGTGNTIANHPAVWGAAWPTQPAGGYPTASAASNAIRSVRRLTDTSVDLYLLQRSVPCSQTAVANGGLYTTSYGPSRDLLRVIVTTAGGPSAGGEVRITLP